MVVDFDRRDEMMVGDVDSVDGLQFCSWWIMMDVGGGSCGRRLLFYGRYR